MDIKYHDDRLVLWTGKLGGGNKEKAVGALISDNFDFLSFIKLHGSACSEFCFHQREAFEVPHRAIPLFAKYGYQERPELDRIVLFDPDSYDDSGSPKVIPFYRVALYASRVMSASELYFLAQGHKQYEYLIPDNVDEPFELDIPFHLINNDFDDGFTSITKVVDESGVYSGKMRYSFIGCRSNYYSTFEAKTKIAQDIFVAVANDLTPERYTVKDGKVCIDDSDTLMRTCVDMLINGKIVPCGHCKKPHYMPHASSKPFCGKSCQQRYRETAQAFFNECNDPEKTAAEFPLIKPATIYGWSK